MENIFLYENGWLLRDTDTRREEIYFIDGSNVLIKRLKKLTDEIVEEKYTYFYDSEKLYIQRGDEPTESFIYQNKGDSITLEQDGYIYTLTKI